MLTFAFISEAGIGGKKDGALALTAVELLCKDDLEHEDCCVGQSVACAIAVQRMRIHSMGTLQRVP